ncbi:hypothetical protein JD474_02720 [Aeromonas caviae]|uniref:hypothetical protein n=1 Tax=Aeromonas caviae TaxID=648 RepID=UPI00191FCB8D|nr:hypothetical protein [Aeromonas caviae]MBL0528016.1 hypothetical protein [Aeromonas caviae]
MNALVAGARLPFDLASLSMGRCATASWGRSRATTASPPARPGRGGHGRTGALTPIPFDTAIAVPYSAATQVTDYKVRLYPTRLPGQVVRTGPIMVTVSVP